MNLDNLDLLSLKIKGMGIGILFALGWGAIIGLGIFIFGETGTISIAQKLLGGFIGGSIISAFLFILFHTPLNQILKLINHIPYGGLFILPFVLFYYIMVWPGVFIAEKMGLIERYIN